ncbi:metalloregulator ArsR/SmtB family transcription factor [Coraliomargarita sp. SDUM461003]|uniref:Metalloregulator ArsR/SmtB family transcription factor n=2 Tax=Thalassobacterium maritimum TaxID=3041265 RepID=A0ABU1AZV3_9BACT|nr:transcriptional regulator [Puniceicoccaceae bacterium]MDQ8209192.1 metalloregulator ArsR/SmtB family transcription factor [Coraliomargarita sp. SDUM461003]HBR92568.1 transcriptional regulator [Opitutae bacterium]|tara:strand:- start:241 stop:612 length:372 start_codon:yes stop_codon:yes gene_type:complete
MNDLMNMTKALADESRVRVIAALSRHEELCGCQVVELLRLATPTVSRHMAVLQSAGLVQSRKEGRWVYYALAKDFPVHLRAWLDSALADAEEIQADRLVLEEIVSCTVQDLCRDQKKRKEEAL